MTKHDLEYAESMIKDYCDTLIDEIKELQTQLQEKIEENKQLKQKLEDLGVEL